MNASSLKRTRSLFFVLAVGVAAGALADGFTAKEKEILSRCLDRKRTEVEACKADCRGAFGPEQVDEQGRKLRDACTLACGFMALDQCCESHNIDCNK